MPKVFPMHAPPAAIPALSRRRLLRSAAASTVLSAGPGLVVASGMPAVAQAEHGATLRVYSWSGYFTPALLNDFHSKTGIRAVVYEFATGEEMLLYLKSRGSASFDVVHPQADWLPLLADFDMIQPLDEKRIQWDGCQRPLVEGGAARLTVLNGRRYLAPANWGTEALAYDSKHVTLKYGSAGYGDLWRPEFRGKVTVRAHSALIALGLWLEGQGRLPRPMADCFRDDEVMRSNFEVILRAALEQRRAVGQFWNDDASAQEAFRTNGCVLGLTWDVTAAALRRETLSVRYVAPKEGALAWMEGFALVKGAPNTDAAYAWINWFYTPETGARFANHTSLAVASKGTDRLLEEGLRSFQADAYPGDALEKLWWWPPQPAWYVAARNNYIERLLSN